ncbi:type IV secretory system conjugative DNA transfer family protein [Aromatoleum anaerobium]|uniref:TraM recognition domain-containing protein n=1 Tax=Aromatoleum anaerobium TaxID=182180 RepID=A0ABX1PS90_9RHOO|nr:type IV secretory system conjugative DNA transfer family protein [Aromatoleum anaerobium]MCK0505281.1 type IV secretory system conjugative DNA transfer family protein [Aromatoleum anaerobium]
MKLKMNNAVGPQVRTKKATGGRLLPALGALSLGGGLQSATQFFAHTFNYQANLGSHFNHVYAPWSILEWSSKWYSHYPHEIMKAASVGMMVSTVGLLGVAVAKVVSSNSSKANEYLHGSARWAGKKDIQAAGLLPRPRSILEVVTGKGASMSTGVYVGGWEDKDGNFHYLRHNGPEHVLTYAPTRSGKGVGLVVPTMLSWGASAVVTDLKGELWAMTAGWRKKHAKNKVLRFEPATASGSVCWNPLDEIRLGTEYEVGDVQNLATLIVDPNGKGLDSHWQKTAFALLVGVILHALYKAKDDGTTATLPLVDAMLADPNRDIGELWMEMATYGHVAGQNHHAIGSTARDMMDRPEEEAGSVLSTAKSYLALYRDPVVARNVSRSEFRIRDLMHSDDPVTLYIVTQPNDKDRLRPLVRVMVNMVVRLLADKMDFENGRPVAHYKHRLLMMLDEFPSLGKLQILQESLAFVAGYGIKCYLICQDINQLKSRETGYGPDETITSNCHVQNAYPPNRVETAEHLSRLTGQTTVVKEQITTSGRRTAAMLGQVSRTFQEVQRPLLTPDECLRMPGPRKNADGNIEEAGDMVVYVAGHPAIYGKQPLYFKDPVFQARASVPAPKVSDRLIQFAEAGEGITI